MHPMSSIKASDKIKFNSLHFRLLRTSTNITTLRYQERPLQRDAKKWSNSQPPQEL